MEGVLPLYFGESNLPTPSIIKEAVKDALDEGYTFYTQNAGLPSLRKAIAAKYLELHHVDLDPMQNIVVAASGVQALNLAVRSVLDPGDEAIVLTPAWPNGAANVKMCSAKDVQIPYLFNGERYEIDFSAIEAAVTSRTRLMIYTSPSNPLGWVALESDQERLLDLCRKHGIWLLADEVYERLYYPGPVAPSILRKCNIDEDAVIVVHSFSKSYCMTGWRLGWLVSHPTLANKAAELNEFIVSHAASMTQKAGETALAEGEGELREMVERLRENRDHVRDALEAMPNLTVPRAEGSFYLFPKVDGMTDSFEFCRQLLIQQKVGLAPGIAFGEGGEGSVRICYAADRSILDPALERIDTFLRS
jgi:aspartate/methionine/tyrosine aminotransferase